MLVVAVRNEPATGLDVLCGVDNTAAMASILWLMVVVSDGVSAVVCDEDRKG